MSTSPRVKYILLVGCSQRCTTLAFLKINFKECNYRYLHNYSSILQKNVQKLPRIGAFAHTPP